jgi:hypothetical protein
MEGGTTHPLTPYLKGTMFLHPHSKGEVKGEP